MKNYGGGVGAMDVIPVSSVNPLNIMPAEIWTEVLKNLDGDPNIRDLINATETCLLFRDLLSSRSNGCRLEEVLPLVLQWLPKTDVLNSRLVCKKITTCVDRILCNKHLVSNIRHFGLYRKLWMRRIPSERFAGRSQNRQPTPKFQFEIGGLLESHYTNEFSLMGGVGETIRTFQGRRLRYSQFNTRNNTEYLVHLSNSLDILKPPVLRHWIGYLEMCGYYNGSDAVLMYESVCQLFEYLGNLEVFVIEVNVRNGSQSWGQRSLAELDGYIKSHQLPVMPCLKRVIFKKNIPVRFFAEICRKYGDQLKGLEMGVIGHYSFPVLKQLRIHDRNNRALPRIDAPEVDHLDLDCVDKRMGSEVAFLENFPNLKSLVFWRRFPVTGIIGPAENLQHVKHLYLRHYDDLRYPVSVLVSHFPGLETLNVEINFLYGWPRVSGEFEDDWKILCEGRGYELGIWEESSLQSFNVSLEGIPGEGHEEFVDLDLEGIYTREGYIKFRKHQKKEKRVVRRILRVASSVLGLSKCFGIKKNRRNE